MDFLIGNCDNEEYILPDAFDSDPLSLQEEYAPEINEPIVRIKYEYDGIDQVSHNSLGETKVPLQLLLTPNASESSLNNLLTIEQSCIDESTSDVKLQNNGIQNQVKRELETVTEVSTKRKTPISSNDVINKTTPLIDNNFGVKHCLAPYCNFKWSKNEKIQLHDVPLDKDLQKQWFDSLSQAHRKLGSFFLVDPLREKQSVCSRHFTEDDFRTYFTYKNSGQEISSRILLDKAVPSIYNDSRKFPFCGNSETHELRESVRIKNLPGRERKRLQKSTSVPAIEESYTKYPRPPFSATILNALALLNRVGRGMVRGEMAGWIIENFPFFKSAKVLVYCNYRKSFFFKQTEKVSETYKSVWTINEKHKGKLLKFIEEQCRKDKNAVRRAMSNPDALELMIKGEFKKCKS